MGGRIVSQKAARHRCEPPREDTSRVFDVPEMGFPGGLQVPAYTFHPQHEPGTLWECGCGRWWRACYPYADVFVVEWRRARWAKHWHAWRTVLGL